MKTFLMISPQYPPRLRFLANRLKAKGFNVVGIGDADWGSLVPESQADLTEYCRVNMDCYKTDGSIDPDVYAGIFNTACYLADKYGKPEYIESFNEWWLPLDAQLREDMQVQGNKPKFLQHIIKKSLMKDCFRMAGVAVVDGEVVTDVYAMHDFMQKCENDIIVKPNHGVGASFTYRLKTHEDVENFFENKNKSTEFYMEKFIAGTNRELYSFDGITDADGVPAFYTVHKYCDGIMEVVGGQALSYHNLKSDEIPAELKKSGFASVKSFNLKKNFFHIEFFKSDGVFYGLEINARPPGVVTLDMINHSKGMDCWAVYADICANGHTEIKPSKDLICGYAARLFANNYLFSHTDIMSKYGSEIVFDMPMDSKVMGDYCYLTLTSSHQRRQEILDAVTAVK